MPNIYLTHWNLDLDAPSTRERNVRPPGDWIGLLDIRTTPVGVGIAVYPGRRNFPELVEELPGIEDNITSAQRDAVTRELLLPSTAIRSNNMRDVLTELMLSDDDGQGDTVYDVSGGRQWKPVIFTTHKAANIWLGGYGRIYAERATPSSLCYKAYVSSFQADYVAVRNAGATAESLRDYTGYKMLQLFGRMSDNLSRDLLPEGFKNDGWSPPRTIKGDTFVEGSDTVIASHTPTGADAGDDWDLHDGTLTVIAASDDLLSGSGGTSRARMNNALSGDNQRCDADGTINTNGDRVGVACRYVSTGTDRDYYRASFATEDGGPGRQLKRFLVGGAGDGDLATDATDEGAGNTIAIQSRADGSDISMFREGVLLLGPITDTNISGSTHRSGGVVTFDNQSVLDNFIAQDLVAVDLIEPPLLHTFAITRAASY